MAYYSRERDRVRAVASIIAGSQLDYRSKAPWDRARLRVKARKIIDIAQKDMAYDFGITGESNIWGMPKGCYT